jgi:hypothetical protein
MRASEGRPVSTDKRVGKDPRWRYEVTKVWGSMRGRLNPGDVIVETEWKGREGWWEIRDLTTLEPTGGWRGQYIGEVRS